MSWQTDMANLPHAHGEPLLHGSFKQVPDDFQVEEQLGFVPDGRGEHEFLFVEKTGLNTTDVQLALARAYRLPLQRISFAGLKDKQARTRQWFSVHVGLNAAAAALDSLGEGISVLQRVRNSRKLQRGSHRANRFVVRVRDCAPLLDNEYWHQKLAQIRQRGVPNYFGPQRFGRGADNLAQAARWFAGQDRDPGSRNKRSMLLSSARSLIFNAVLAERVASGSWDRILPGEAVALSGSASTFASAQATMEELQLRLDDFDIHPTGPMWGNGESRACDQVAQMEAAIAARYDVFAAGLQQQGLRQERRALRLQVTEFDAEMQAGSLVLSFTLVRGAYATAVLRELVKVESP